MMIAWLKVKIGWLESNLYKVANYGPAGQMDVDGDVACC